MSSIVASLCLLALIAACGREGSFDGTRADLVWGLHQDSLDVNYAVRIRIEPALPTTENR